MEREDLENNRVLRKELTERRNNGEYVTIKNGMIVEKRKNRYEITERYSTQTYQSFQPGNNLR